MVKRYIIRIIYGEILLNARTPVIIFTEPRNVVRRQRGAKNFFGVEVPPFIKDERWLNDKNPGNTEKVP
jgi:hypothetical protein